MVLPSPNEPKRLHHRFSAQPIGRWIFIIMLLVALVPVSFLSIKLYQAALNNAWREVGEKHLLLAENLAQPIRIYVTTHLSILNTLSLELSETGYVMNDPHHSLLLVNTLRSFADFSSLTWARHDGEIISYFDQKHSVDSRIKNISTNPTFADAVNSRRPQVAYSRQGPLSNSPALLMIQPVLNSNDNLQGLLIAELSTTVLENLRANIRFGTRGHAEYVDQSGNILLMSLGNEIGKTLAPNDVQLGKSLHENKQGVFEFYSTAFNDKMVSVYARINELGFGVLISQPKHEIESNIRALVLRQFAWGLVGLIAALISGFVLVRWITRPIDKLAQGARELSNNNFHGALPDLPDFAPREIRELSAAFNAVTTGFQQSTGEIETLNTSLQHRVDQATSLLRENQKKLERALEEVKQASRAKSSFLANMSHELRTPMNAIIGYSEILEEEILHAGMTKLLPDMQRIQSAGKHLLTIINDVLDLSKIEAGKMAIYLETFPIELLINEVVNTVMPLVSKHQNTLVTHCENNIGDMHADIVKIKQILLNLIGNAAKFTQNGKIKFDIRSEIRQGRPFILFEVTDNGIGMSQEQQTELFKEFTQADNSTTRKYGGTGLGLTITRYFCHMMGGDIFVHSELGQGSRFSVYLPTVVTATDIEHGDPEYKKKYDARYGIESPEEQRMGEKARSQWQNSERRKNVSTILIIDDDPSTRDILQRFLRKRGFNTETAARATQGLKLAHGVKPNVITLDLNMPEMDGWTLMDELKHDPDTKDIPTVILTMTDPEDSAWKTTGASAYLTKPIDRNKVENLIKKLVRKTR